MSVLNDTLTDIAERLKERVPNRPLEERLGEAIRLIGEGLPHILDPRQVGGRAAAHAYDRAVSATAELMLALQALTSQSADEILADVERRRQNSAKFDEHVELNYVVDETTAELSAMLLWLGEAISAPDDAARVAKRVGDALVAITSTAHRLHTVRSATES